MVVTLEPAEFTLVQYEPTRIVALAEKAAVDVGLDGDLEITVHVDETTPLIRSRIESMDPVVLEIQSGAFEEPKAPRQLSERATADVLGRLLYRVADRLDDAFGEPPVEADVGQQHRNAWDTYAVGRLARLGYPSQRQRRLYTFRTRHSFSDDADQAFHRLWNADTLTWSDITSLSDRAA
jgi:hypothetical protein